MPAACKVVQIAHDIHWVGVEDWNRRSFDAVMDLPYGTSYNAYLVRGREKIALVDTVQASFGDELMQKVRQVVDPGRIDYLVMNHAEPDHAGSIPVVMAAAPGAKLLASEKGVEMARVFFQVPAERMQAMQDGGEIDLGGKRLRFVAAPWLHWPETMFSFAVEDGVLFTCDFFGAHLASDLLFADEVGGAVLPEAKLYYAVIMMPYAKMASAGLDKAVALQPSIIAPGHGPVWRSPKPVIDAIEQWTRGPLLKKAIIPYVTMWGSTRRMAEVVTASLSGEGIETIPYDLSVTDLARLARDLVDTSAVVMGSPTVLGTVHPLIANAASMVRLLRPRARIGAFFGSYGWGGGAAAQAKATLESVKMQVVDSVDVKGPPGQADLERLAVLGKNVASKITGATAPE
ncbi:MAG: FprA family A-type flavoprotein [Chloroflexi bacterium]|nr:FprA family A-type flavoprotein [Chloroflexota bacterium]